MEVAAKGKLPFKARLTREQRRERILDAAEERFAQRGYDATSLAEVARAAGITKAVIYEHFGSKTELYIAALEQRASELVALIYERMDALDESASAEDSLRTALEAFFAFAKRRRTSWDLLFRDPPAEPRIAEACLAVREMARAAVAERLRRHPAAEAVGLTASDPRITLAAEFLIAGLVGVAGRWYPNQDKPPETVVDELVRLAWPGLEQLARSLSPAAPSP